MKEKEGMGIGMDMKFYKYFTEMLSDWTVEKADKISNINFIDIEKMFSSSIKSLADIENSANFEGSHIKIINVVANKIMENENFDLSTPFIVVDRLRLPIMALPKLKERLFEAIDPMMTFIKSFMNEYKIDYIADFMENKEYEFKDGIKSAREVFELVEKMAESSGQGMNLYLWLDEIETDCHDILRKLEELA